MDRDFFDMREHADILQLYTGELRAIGEVMLVPNRKEHDSSNMKVLGYAEFVRRMSHAAPGESSTTAASPEAWEVWVASPERQTQVCDSGQGSPSSQQGPRL
ncbi:MAG: hypothetical protein WDW36_008039 [Sanguina aurantia]